MKQFKLKINSKLSGIKESSVSIQRGPDLPDGSTLQPGETSSVADAIRIRQLNGRIKILELELQKAREDSFKVGFEEGRRSTITEAQKSVEAMRIEMQAMEIKYLETVEQIEVPLLDLARKMAREVLAIELQNREDLNEVLVERLRKMLYELVEQNKIIIEANPEQVAFLKENNWRDEMNLPEQMDLNIVGNSDLAKGEANLKSADFYVDGSYDAQLNHLHEQLRDKEE